MLRSGARKKYNLIVGKNLLKIGSQEDSSKVENILSTVFLKLEKFRRSPMVYKFYT